jgi:hypothetical protein
MRLILADKSAGRTTGVTSERLINLYAAPQEEGSESILSLNSVPGTRDFATLPGPFLRGLCEVDGVLYAISAGELYSVAANGTATLVAAISDDAATTMAGHRGGLTIASSGGYSLWDGSSLTQPGSGRISTGGHRPRRSDPRGARTPACKSTTAPEAGPSATRVAGA